MIPEIKYIDIKQQILSRNKNVADEVRSQLASKRVFLLNLMSSPGSGKTSLIVQTIRRLKTELNIGVIEGDIESLVDSEKIAAEGIPAVQLRTGGSCHLDAAMISAALDELQLGNLDLVFVENIGNLVCPASFDIGAEKKVMILSVPEGDDKILKYPLMFSVVDAIIINKVDYIPLSDFNMEALKNRMKQINPHAMIFEVSCKTGEGLTEWCEWLKEAVLSVG
jgi:hydrogenase nickel incorporation protein HypB